MARKQDPFLEGLNPAQREAVATESGPMLVLAGAGTGKTRVVTFRIARLISRRIKPERILAVTFTNKAAGEMKERVAELLKKGRKLATVPEISTFHSLCVRVLRRHIQRLGYPAKFTIYAQGQQESVARRALREIRATDALLRPGDLLSYISNWKTHSVTPRQAAAAAISDKDHFAAAAYRRYQETLKAAGAVDFDDLLLCTEQLFAQHVDIRRDEAARFDHVLIDEYQDTNRSQYRIVRALAASHRNLCVVGDDDQSIYGWRGAEVQHILNFRKDWPDAKVVRLEENYRSSGEIITLANRLIQHNRLRHDKKLIPVRGQGEKPTIQQFASEDEEAEQIIANIARRIEKGEVEPRDIAILFRTNEQPRLFETELRKRKLPYVLIGGMSFFDRKEIRDCLAYMQLIADPNDDVSLMRVINTPPRGIGPKTVESLMAESLQQQHSLWDHISTESTTARLTMGTRQSLRSFVAKIDEYRTRAQAEPLTSLTRQMIHDVGYRDEINQHYPEEADRESRWNSVEELVNALGEFEDKKSRRKKKVEMSEFLDDILLSQFDSTDDKEKQLRRNAIVLMTLHAAKGLEFPQVYLVGLEEGILPHQRSVLAMDDSIDEERRLCYVGVTRAQERLTLSRCESRRKWGKQRQAYASRFLYELADMADRARDAIEGYLKSMHIASDAAQQPSRKRKKKA